MTETSQTPEGQSQTAGLERLEQEFAGVPETTTKEEPKEGLEGFTDKVESTTEKKEPETAEEKKPDESAETKEGESVFEFKDQTPTEEEGWKTYFNDFEIQVPEDYSEEKGFEILKSKIEEKYQAREEQIKQFRIDDLLNEFPEDKRAEAKLTIDLLRSGQSLEQINQPLLNIQNLRALTPEQLVRSNYEGLEGWTPEMVDHKMEQLVQSKQIEIEDKILRAYLDNKEKEISIQRQQYLQNYNTQQQAIREQKKQKEFSEFKAALDREKTFLDTPLKDSNKAEILKDFEATKQRLLNDPSLLAKFMVFSKYGEQGLKYFEARALEKANLALAQKKHNIPQTASTAGGGRTINQNNFKTGIERVEAEYSQNT